MLERHCEAVERDPAEIRRTILMPVCLTDDESAAARFINPPGPGSAAGSTDYVVQRIGELIEAGVDEIMFGGVPTDKPEQYQRLDEGILAAFETRTGPVANGAEREV